MTFVPVFLAKAAPFDAQLQGQSKGSTTWINNNLKGWRDLDSIPCRVYLTGGPANNRTIKVEFDRRKNGKPGIDNLCHFTPSANVLITSGPVLSAPPNSSRWSYTFTIKLLDKNPGWVRYNARLALGAHLNGGSSLHMGGSPSLGVLQIHKPGPREALVDLTVQKSGPSEAAPGEVITYTVRYSNNKSSVQATGVRISDVLPPEVTLLPETIGSGQVVNGAVQWDPGNLDPGAQGVLTYSVRVNENVSSGQVFTNAAVISSAHEDANPSDNQSSVATRVIFNRAPVANADSYTGTANQTLNIAAPGVLANDTDADGDVLAAILLNAPGQGTLTLNADGSFQYIPAAGFAGTDAFMYKANDGRGDSEAATVTITIEGVNGNLRPVVSLVHPTNGAIYIAGMDIPLVAEATDPDGTIARVDFLSGDIVLGSSGGTSYELLLTNVPTGEYVLRAMATDDDGATGLSAPVMVTVLEHPPFAAGPFVLNRQTGLFEQTVTITNPTPVAFGGIRLWILDVRSGAKVWNATGQIEGIPYIDVLETIPAGASLSIVIEYYTPDVRIPPEPTFFPEVL